MPTIIAAGPHYTRAIHTHTVTNLDDLAGAFEIMAYNTRENARRLTIKREIMAAEARAAAFIEAANLIRRTAIVGE